MCPWPVTCNVRENKRQIRSCYWNMLADISDQSKAFSFDIDQNAVKIIVEERLPFVLASFSWGFAQRFGRDRPTPVMWTDCRMTQAHWTFPHPFQTCLTGGVYLIAGGCTRYPRCQRCPPTERSSTPAKTAASRRHETRSRRYQTGQISSWRCVTGPLVGWSDR